MLSMEAVHNNLFDGDMSTAVTLSKMLVEDSTDEIAPVMAFFSNRLVDEVIILANWALMSMVDDGGITVNVAALPTVNLDDFSGDISTSDIVGHPCSMNDRLPQSCGPRKLVFDCNGVPATAVKVSITLHLSERIGRFRINEIMASGNEDATADEEAWMGVGSDFVTQFTSAGPTPTRRPPPTDPGHNDVLQNAIPAVIDETESYRVVWKPSFGTPIPYNKLMATVSSNSDADTDYSQSSLISFLAKRGYLDYVLAKDRATKGSVERTKTKVGSDDIVDSIKLLQRFNGFPETGEASKDTFGFVTEPRCGVSDVEYNEKEVEEENQCFTLYRDKKINDPSVSSSGALTTIVNDLVCYM